MGASVEEPLLAGANCVTVVHAGLFDHLFAWGQNKQRLCLSPQCEGTVLRRATTAFHALR